MVVDARDTGVAPESVDRLEPADRDEPGDRIGRHAVARPLLGGGDESVVLGFLGALETAEQADQGGEDASPVAAVDRLERGDAIRGQPCFAQASASAYDVRASWVRLSPKSSISNSGRISISDALGIGFGQRRTHSIACSSERTFQIQ